MIDNTSSERKASLLTSSEGKRIIFFTLLLCFVLGMMLYSHYTKKPEADKKLDRWQKLLRDKTNRQQEIIGSGAYKQILLDLREIEEGTYERIRKKQETSPPDPQELRQENPDARGRFLSFKGEIQRKPVRIEFPVSNHSVTIRELKVQDEEKNLSFSVHLILPPDNPLVPGTVVSGEGMYLTTKSHPLPEDSGQDGQRSPEIYLMARSIRILRSAKTSENKPGTGKKDPKGPSTESVTTPGDRPANPETYSDRKSVTSYWNKLLATLDPEEKIKAEDQLFKRMVKEVKNVKQSDLHAWTDSSITPATLKKEPARPHRGNVISFQGKFIRRYKKELLGGPQNQDVVWEYWIRDQKNHLTYTFYSFRKANFALKRGTSVEGKGVFLNKQTYPLLNPRKAGANIVKKGRTVVVLGIELDPLFTTPASEKESTVLWVQYVIGGLIVLSLAIFLVMIYISWSGDVEDRVENFREIRRRKSDPDLPDDSSSDNDPSSTEPAS